MTDNIDNKIPFTYKINPFNHQSEWLHNTWSDEYHAVFWEMGTGKSKFLIDTAAMLYLDNKINGILITAPKGAYLNWVFNEIPKHMSNDVDYRLAYWSSALKKREKDRLLRILEPIDGKLDILCINIEALSVGRGPRAAEAFIKNHRTLMCVDESTTIKSPKANRTKTCMKLSKLVKFRRIMSGAPITQSPLDLFSQCKFLKPGLLGFTSYFSFRHYYAIIIQMKMGTRQFPKIKGYKNIEELKRRLLPFSSRIFKRDCLDLPEKTFSKIYVELSNEQRQAYNSLRQMSVVELEDGMITITSILTALIKLQQIICGHIKDEDGEIIDIKNNRVSMLLEILEEIEDKVIIWCNFVHDIKIVSNALIEMYGRDSTVTYYGETETLDRVRACKRFQEDDECRFFVSTSAGSKGITLTACNYNIYYSHSYNLENYLQSQDRTHRIGQTRNVHYISLVSPNTIDEKILRILEQKKNVADYVMNNWEELFSEDPWLPAAYE